MTEQNEKPAVAKVKAMLRDVAAHERQEGDPAEYRTASGSWVDMADELTELLRIMTRGTR